jgi:hypothetical protein
MFKILGALLICYVAHGLSTGQIYGRYRAWGRTFRRDDDPWLYWSTMAVYSLLAMALIFLFGLRGRS